MGFYNKGERWGSTPNTAWRGGILAKDGLSGWEIAEGRHQE